MRELTCVHLHARMLLVLWVRFTPGSWAARQKWNEAFVAPPPASTRAHTTTNTPTQDQLSKSRLPSRGGARRSERWGLTEHWSSGRRGVGEESINMSPESVIYNDLPCWATLRRALGLDLILARTNRTRPSKVSRVISKWRRRWRCCVIKTKVCVSCLSVTFKI